MDIEFRTAIMHFSILEEAAHIPGLYRVGLRNGQVFSFESASWATLESEEVALHGVTLEHPPVPDPAETRSLDGALHIYDLNEIIWLWKWK